MHAFVFLALLVAFGFAGRRSQQWCLVKLLDRVALSRLVDCSS